MPDGHSQLVEGLSIPKMSLLDPSGTVVWSTDSQSISTSKLESPLYQQAIAGGTASRLARAQDVIDAMGVSRRMDIVETHLPLRETPSGQIIGVMEVSRSVGRDVALQVDDTRAAVLRTTVATMGGLFIVLFGFIVAADLTIYRSNKREVSLVESQLEERREAERALRRSEEVATQLAGENAVLAAMGRIISSSLDIDEVYNRFTEQVRKLIPFDRTVITVLDWEQLTATASYVEGVDMKDRCPASTIFASLASISFAGSPPRPGPVAGLHRCGSWGRQIPG